MHHGLKLYDAIADVDPVSAMVDNLLIIALPIAAVLITTVVILLIRRKWKKAGKGGKPEKKDE